MRKFFLGWFISSTILLILALTGWGLLIAGTALFLYSSVVFWVVIIIIGTPLLFGPGLFYLGENVLNAYRSKAS